MSNKFNLHRVLLQAGHGGVDKGAAANGTNENFEVNQVIALAVPMLKARGVDVVHMADLPFTQSIAEVNRISTLGDWALEIHMDSFSTYNSFSMDDRYGVYHLGGSARSKEIGDVMLKKWLELGANKTSWNRADTLVRFGRLGWIRDTKPTAHLVELGFIQDNQGAIDDQLHAKLLTEAICAVMGK